jgi:hypothetical protein
MKIIKSADKGSDYRETRTVQILHYYSHNVSEGFKISIDFTRGQIEDVDFYDLHGNSIRKVKWDHVNNFLEVLGQERLNYLTEVIVTLVLDKTYDTKHIPCNNASKINRYLKKRFPDLIIREAQDDQINTIYQFMVDACDYCIEVSYLSNCVIINADTPVTLKECKDIDVLAVLVPALTCLAKDTKSILLELEEEEDD